jgi:streptomycin 3"-adenylyltransferase
VLLTLARIWVTIETGSILPKDQAAEWASARLPPRAAVVLQHARTLYLTSTSAAEPTWDPQLRDEVASCVEQLLERIGLQGPPDGSRTRLERPR